MEFKSFSIKYFCVQTLIPMSGEIQQPNSWNYESERSNLGKYIEEKMAVVEITLHSLTDLFQIGWHSTASHSNLSKIVLGTSMAH